MYAKLPHGAPGGDRGGRNDSSIIIGSIAGSGALLVSLRDSDRGAPVLELSYAQQPVPRVHSGSSWFVARTKHQ